MLQQLYNNIPKWVWKLILSIFISKYLLYFLVGINITYFNPIKCKFGLTYKDILEIRNVQIIPLQKKIIVSGMTLKKTLPLTNNNNSKEEKVEKNIIIPKWIFARFKYLIYFFNDFRIALNHVDVPEYNFKLSVLYFVLFLREDKDNNNDKLINIEFMLRNTILNNDDICSELFLNLRTRLLPNQPNIKTSFDKISCDLKLGKIMVPMETIYNLKTNSTSVKVTTTKSLTIDESVLNIIRNLQNISKNMKMIEEFNITADRFTVNNFALTTHEKVREINEFLSYHICISNLTFNASRYKKTMPGYLLIFKDEDTPFKTSLTLSRLTVCLNMNRKEGERTFVKFLEIPNISLFGESNIISQIFKHDYGKSLENGVLTLKGNISSPTFEIDVKDLSFLKCFLNNIKVFKKAFSDPVTITYGDDCGKNKMKMTVLSLFKSFLPLINAKIIVDEPRFIVKDNENLIIGKFCSLLINCNSKRYFQVMSQDSLKQERELVYESQIMLEVLDLKLQHIIKGKDYKHTILKIDSISFQDSIRMEPKHIVRLCGDIDTFEVDLSELTTMVMLNQMVRKLDCQMSIVENNYFKPLYERFASRIKSTKNKCSLISETLEEKTILPSSFLFKALPEIFDYFKVDIRNFHILLGARSVFMPQEVFSSIESQSSHDLVDGKLRKFCLKVNQLQIALSGNYTQWRNKYDKNSITMVETGQTSTYRSYGNDGLDDISTSESTAIGYLWSFNILVDNIVCSVIGEAPDATNELTRRTVSKLSVLSVNVFPETDGYDMNQERKIKVQIDNKKVTAVFSLMNVFLIVSGIHTLNQIFSHCIRNKDEPESMAKKYLVAIAKSQRKSCWKLVKWSEIKSFLEINFSSEVFNEIMSLPNGLRTKIETFATFVKVTNLQDIEATGSYFRTCMESPTMHSSWERFVVINNFSIRTNINDLKEQKHMSYDELQSNPAALVLENESWHFSVPYGFELHRLIDNFSTVIKSIKQMLYSLKTSKNNLVIFPKVSKTSGFPKIKLKSGRYILSIADDPFEAEMNTIFQIGLQEQKARLTKVKEFNDAMLDKLSQTKQIRVNKDATVSELLNTKRLNTSVKSNSKANRKISVPLIQMPFNSNGKTNTKISLEDAISEETERFYDKLQNNISTSWIRRIQSHRRNENEQFQRNFSFIWGNIDFNSLPDNVNKQVRDFTTNPFLSNLIMENIDVDICKPSFDIEGIPDFIHRVGKGVPKENTYSIMIPFHVDAHFSEIRWHMRDYPLPFINVPPLKPSQSSEKSALHIYGDLVVAEDMIASEHELRVVFVPLVPSIIVENKDEYYSLKVPRTVTSLKFYTDLNLDVNTKGTTQLNMGSSYQPAIQQTMQCLENISKPPLDPSKKTGFWDKIRYLFHGHIKISWTTNNKFEVGMKGTKSPYMLGGQDAGFVLGFGDNVVLNINEDEDPKKFVSCSSDELYFSVPNPFAKPLLVWSRSSSDTIFIPNQDDTNLQWYASYYYLLDLERKKNEVSQIEKMSSAYIEKNCIKLTGGVMFNIGFVFERIMMGKTINDRTFNSVEHYKVRLTNPIYVQNLETHDSYAGFRSDFIHMSFTLLSKTDSAYNTMQLSPNSLDTFFKWWKTFSGNFPVRHGKLFNVKNNAPKFGEHLYSISYHADAQPLYIVHMVHNIDADRLLRKNFLSATEFAGLKGKTDRFTLDLHQRKELLTEYNAELNIRKKVKKMKFLEGNLLMKNVDIRTVHGKFKRLQYVEQKEDAKYDIFDNDMAWLDITDFQELFFINLEKYLPSIYIKPFMFAPIFMYKKRASYGDKFQLDPITYESIIPFRNDLSHNCVVNESMKAPTYILDDRALCLKAFKEKIEHQLKKTDDMNKRKEYKDFLDKADSGLEILDLLQDDFTALCHESERTTSLNRTFNIENAELLDKAVVSKRDFENRFFVFNMLLKWNENIRNVLLKFLHYLNLANDLQSLSSQKTIRLFEDMISHRITSENKFSGKATNDINVPDTNIDRTFQISSDENGNFTDKCVELFESNITKLGVDFNHIIHKNNFIQFVIPQVQLMTKENPDSCVIITAPNVISKIVTFEEKTPDNVYLEELFMKRFGVIINNANAFVLHKKDFKGKCELFFNLDSYGQNNDWSPWLGVEHCFYNAALDKAKLVTDLTAVVNQQNLSSFSSTYEKVKNHIEDKLSIHLPRINLASTSADFGLLYSMGQKLLLYEEPEKKQLNKEIEKLAIYYDIDNAEKICDTVTNLCENQLILLSVEKELLFRRHILDDLSSIDLSNVHNERKNHLLRLYMLMKIIESNSIWKKNSDEERPMLMRIKINEIILNLLHDSMKPFLEVNVDKLIFKRSLMGSGFTSNNLIINMMQVFSLEDDSRYPNILGPYTQVSDKCIVKLLKDKKKSQDNNVDKPLIDLIWEHDKPVGGIKIINNIDVFFSGLNIQLEDNTISKIVKWINLSDVNKKYEEFSKEDEDDEFLDIFENKTDESESLKSQVQIANKDSPDVTDIVQRSADYMIVERMIFNSFKLNVSYKGKGKKRLINVTDFLFTFPKLLLDNQMMKFIDILYTIKKILVKVLLRHSGKFIGNKLRRRRSSKNRSSGSITASSLSNNAIKDDNNNNNNNNKSIVPSPLSKSPPSTPPSSPSPPTPTGQEVKSNIVLSDSQITVAPHGGPMNGNHGIITSGNNNGSNNVKVNSPLRQVLANE